MSRDQPAERLPFDARLSPVAPNATDFAVAVDAPGADLEGLRESVRFPATRYCLRTFGSSEVIWQTAGGPEAWAFARTPEGRLVFQGRCRAR